MIPGKDEARVCGYIRSEFIHWTLWRTLMRTKYFLFVHHTISILAKRSTWCFEHSGDISFSLLVNPSHTDESWEGRNTCMWIATDNFSKWKLNFIQSKFKFGIRIFRHYSYMRILYLLYSYMGAWLCQGKLNIPHTFQIFFDMNVINIITKP